MVKSNKRVMSKIIKILRVDRVPETSFTMHLLIKIVKVFKMKIPRKYKCRWIRRGRVLPLVEIVIWVVILIMNHLMLGAKNLIAVNSFTYLIRMTWVWVIFSTNNLQKHLIHKTSNNNKICNNNSRGTLKKFTSNKNHPHYNNSKTINQ